MPTETQDMRRFLLGDLPDSDASVLEAELMADDERFEQMWEMENDLVDDYVRGRLPRTDQERFERNYLSSPVHVQRVAVARKLLEAADASPAGITAAPRQTYNLSEKANVWRRTLQYALVAAVLLFAVTTVWLILERSRLTNQLAQIQSENNSQQSQQRDLAGQVAAARAQNDKLASELEQLQATKPTKEQQPSPTPPEQTQSASVFSFVLSPMLVRGSGDPQTLTIPKTTDVVRLQMRANQKAAGRFQVSVRTVEGGQIWQKQANLRKGVVTAQIPASKLPLGDYILTLSAMNPTGQPEEINRYFFRVIRH